MFLGGDPLKKVDTLFHLYDLEKPRCDLAPRLGHLRFDLRAVLVALPRLRCEE